MTDGFRSDFGGETLEEMRVRENNPYLTSVTRQRIDKMLHLYLQALSAPFSEITKEEYDNWRYNYPESVAFNYRKEG